MKYILSVGTNMGDKMKNIENAINAINNIPYTDVVKVSSVYQTEPVGYLRQDDFYNIVMLVESQFDPHEMLGICMGIESGFGRVRALQYGPRIMDLDLILAEDNEYDTANLTVPHPRYHERRFVLEPLLEIFPSGEVFGIEFKHFIDDIDGQFIEKIGTVNPDLIA